MDKNSNRSLYEIFNQIIRFHFDLIHSRLQKVGIYPGQPPILFTLSHNDGLSQRELAQKIHVKAATLTIMINRMQKADLLLRRQDARDQRISRVFLTDKGKKMEEKVGEILESVERECFDNLTNDELIILRRLLMQVKDNLSNSLNSERVKNL